MRARGADQLRRADREFDRGLAELEAVRRLGELYRLDPGQAADLKADAVARMTRCAMWRATVHARAVLLVSRAGLEPEVRKDLAQSSSAPWDLTADSVPVTDLAPTTASLRVLTAPANAPNAAPCVRGVRRLCGSGR
jgi:hypothetical protein